MPPLVEDLVIELVRNARTDSKAHGGGGVFLFPGQHYGRPIVGESLRRRLRKLGLDVRQTRQAALFQFAAEMPPEILADLLGIHINTAVSWVRSRGGNWKSYAALRSSQHANGVRTS